MPVAHLRGGVGAEAVGQRGAQPLVGGQPVGGTARGGQRVEQDRGEVLAQRVLGGELLEDRQRLGGPARGDQPGGALAPGPEVQLLQRRPGAGRVGGVVLLQRPAAPQRQRGVQRGERGGAVGLGPGSGHEAGEADGVDVLGVDCEPVAGRGLLHQRRVAEGAAQA